jgi:hypothetical protein
MRMTYKVPKNEWWLKYKGTIKQKEKLRQLPPYCSKFLENGLMRNDVKSVNNVNLKHHPIKLGIQNGPNTMDHNLITSFNHPRTNMVTNEKQTHHKTIGIKPNSLTNKMFLPLY